MKQLLLFCLMVFYIDGIAQPLHYRPYLQYGNNPTLVHIPFDGTLAEKRIHTAESYYTLFHTVPKDSLPVINFIRYDLVQESICVQCYFSCPHYQASCHRNACGYTAHWVLKDKPAYQSLDYELISSLDCSFPFSSYKDTLAIQTQEVYQKYLEHCTGNGSNPNNNKLPQLNFDTDMMFIRTEGGDCHARIYHDVYLDHDKKELVWKIINYWGGCRAGNFWDFGLKVKKPPVGYKIRFDNEQVKY